MKIFGIGLSKTGTTSLAAALQVLEYKTRDYIGVTRYVPHDLSCIPIDEFNANDAFTDTPIPSFYRELDAAYPGSKFILTVRDRAGWLKSCKKQFTSRHAEIQNEATRQITMDIYGCTSFDEDKFWDGYTRHLEGVMTYFRDRTQDLLVLDLCGGEGWQELCAFLGRPVPDMPFPVNNVTEIQWLKIEDVIMLARRAGDKVPSGFVQRLASQVSTYRRRSKGEAGNIANFDGVLSATVARFAQGRVFGAAEKANALVVEGLSKLAPTTPIIVAGDKELPYSERKKWSYFWLVSSFNELVENSEPAGPLTINIALIEGRRPKLGVVYIPNSGIAYYSRGESGSFKSDRNGASVALLSGQTDDSLVLVNQCELNDAELSCLAPRERGYRREVAGMVSSLCVVAEGKAGAYLYAGKVSEARVAAAHAVLRGVGKQLHDCNTGVELEYNKVDLVHESFKAE